MAKKKQTKKSKTVSKATPVTEKKVITEPTENVVVNTDNDVQSTTESWWESDSVKIVATVIAVLLIPAAIVTWNAMAQNEFNPESETNDTELTINTAEEEIAMNLDDIVLEQTAPVSDDNLQNSNSESDKNIIVVTEETDVNIQVSETAPEYNENLNVSESSSDSVVSKDRPNNIVRVGAIALFFKKISDEFKNLISNREEKLAELQNTSTEQEVTVSENEEIPVNPEVMENENVNTEDQQELTGTPFSVVTSSDNEEVTASEPVIEPSVSDIQANTGDREQGQNESVQVKETDSTVETINPVSLDKVSELPNTSSEFKYVVNNGDNVYSISMKVCGNNSFYINNLNKNYLKVGQEITVKCN